MTVGERPQNGVYAVVPRDKMAPEARKLRDAYARVPGALRFREENTFEPHSYDDLVAAVEKGFARAYWCGSLECEDRVKEETKATVRCLPFEQPGISGPCIVCGGQAEKVAIFGRAY